MPKAQTAPSFEPRVYPAGKAIHFFGAARPELVGRRLTVDGRRASALGFGRLALVVKYVEAEEWSPEAIERRRVDAAWLATQARSYERVVERAMVQSTIVPARMFAIFNGLPALEDVARANYSRWRRALTRIDGKAEWSLSIFRGPHPVPHGDPYVLRVAAQPRVSGLRSARFRGPAGEHVVRLWKSCSAVATASRQIEPHAPRGQLFAATFLLPHGSVEAFREVLSRLGENARDLGLTYYLEGPRPPFSFV